MPGGGKTDAKTNFHAAAKLLLTTLLPQTRTFGRCKVHCDDLIQVHWLSVAHVVSGQS